MYLRTAAVTAALTTALSVPTTAVAYAAPPSQPGGPDKDCTDFSTQLEAQLVLDENPLDFFRLDTDEDGVACESLPGTKIGASTLPTEVERPTGPPTGTPTTPPTPTVSPSPTVTETAPPLPPATRRPSGAPPAGAGGTAAGPADIVLPLGLGLTTLAVAGGVLLLARRRAQAQPDR